VWDLGLCGVQQARDFADQPDDLGFSAGVAKVKEVANAGLPDEHPVAVVYAPLVDQEPALGWDAHSLFEGLSRVGGVADGKRIWKNVRVDLVEVFVPEP